MNGILLIDKSVGPTSHDVVARIRNTARERSVGHTGTLDPRATGLLPLVMGKATRLAPYLSSSEKTYDARLELGVETSTEDAAGDVISRFDGPLPGHDAIAAALDAFRGMFDQVPSTISAKRIDGHKAYDLARADKVVELKPVSVTVSELLLRRVDAAVVELTVTATAGFYVRALARDLGRALGCGAHLTALRRTRSGAFTLAAALPLDEAERLGPDVAAHLINPADALPHFPAVTVNALGYRRMTHGNPISPDQLIGLVVPVTGAGEKVRVLGEDGTLLGLADSRGGALHPAVVLADR
jgi:tRNA pseudouridine55 synthase